ncbi:accessory Sec system protein Asp3 [Staphylococcus auricularis]|uniref:accessory Sec system protein Asp3 n=1 Tax=Staphylococcus auricularis TaxID=29379 RepID=UPI00124893CE|nr:accessory Sec system protein Asp3 [Staphylococcus auricularis]
MTTKHDFTITWQQVNKSTFMYGTQLDFTDAGTIFENPLMPSGIVIHDWAMTNDYTSDKSVPTLPILKRESTYHIEFDYDVTPDTGIYFKLVFYRKNGTELDAKIIQTHAYDFTYPKAAYTYEIQMINSAAQHLTFRQFTITEVTEVPTIEETVVCRFSEVMNERPELNVRNIIFVEPVTQVFGLLQDAIRNVHNVILVEDWHEELSTNPTSVELLIHKLQPLAEENELNLIGFGAASNALVESIAQVVPCRGLITDDQDAAFLQQLQSFIEPQVLPTPSPCYVYHHADALAKQHVAPLLNPTRHLQYLDVTMLNRGGYHETTD